MQTQQNCQICGEGQESSLETKGTINESRAEKWWTLQKFKALSGLIWRAWGGLIRLEGGPASFQYLAQSDTFTLADVDDGEGLRTTLDAMAIIGLGEEEREAVLRTVAAVLHLGNINFAADGDAAVLADQDSADELGIVADLLQVRSWECLWDVSCGCGEVPARSSSSREL